MLNIFIDIETLPQDGALDSYIESAKKNIKVPSSMTKPKLMKALDCDDKYKTVGELKEEWVKKFGAEQAKEQGNNAWRKTSFDGAKGSICVIAVKVEGGNFASFSTKDMAEKEMLEIFWLFVKKATGSTQFRFVAHNAKFDLPFLWHRSVINRVKPVAYNPHGRHGMHHYCTMESWAGFNGKISADNLAKALGITGKGDMDGSKVYDTWQTDKQKVIDYCVDDVRMLEEIYNRLEFVEC